MSNMSTSPTPRLWSAVCRWKTCTWICYLTSLWGTCPHGPSPVIMGQSWPPLSMVMLLLILACSSTKFLLYRVQWKTYLTVPISPAEHLPLSLNTIMKSKPFAERMHSFHSHTNFFYADLMELKEVRTEFKKLVKVAHILAQLKAMTVLQYGQTSYHHPYLPDT